MADPRSYRPVDRAFYFFGLVYLASHFLNEDTQQLNSLIRNPGIAFLLLGLVQVLFPRLRASGLANAISFFVILIPIFHTLYKLDPTNA